MEVKLIKLNNGQDIVAELIEDSGVEVKIKNPLICMLMPNDQTMIMPWCPFADPEEFSISTNNILFTTTPVQDIYNMYNERFGSGIMVTPDLPGLKLHIDD